MSLIPFIIELAEELQDFQRCLAGDCNVIDVDDTDFGLYPVHEVPIQHFSTQKNQQQHQLQTEEERKQQHHHHHHHHPQQQQQQSRRSRHSAQHCCQAKNRHHPYYPPCYSTIGRMCCNGKEKDVIAVGGGGGKLNAANTLANLANKRAAYPLVKKNGWVMVSMNVKQFAPDELIVKTVDNCIIIEGRHEDKEDIHGVISRHFIRKYLLPKGYDPNDVVSTLSSDGILTVKAPPQAPPKPCEDEESTVRIVDIQQTGPTQSPAKDMMVSASSDTESNTAQTKTPIMETPCSSLLPTQQKPSAAGAAQPPPPVAEAEKNICSDEAQGIEEPRAVAAAAAAAAVMVLMMEAENEIQMKSTALEQQLSIEEEELVDGEGAEERSVSLSANLEIVKEISPLEQMAAHQHEREHEPEPSERLEASVEHDVVGESCVAADENYSCAPSNDICSSTEEAVEMNLAESANAVETDAIESIETSPATNVAAAVAAVVSAAAAAIVAATTEEFELELDMAAANVAKKVAEKTETEMEIEMENDVETQQAIDDGDDNDNDGNDDDVEEDTANVVDDLSSFGILNEKNGNFTRHNEMAIEAAGVEAIAAAAAVAVALRPSDIPVIHAKELCIPKGVIIEAATASSSTATSTSVAAVVRNENEMGREGRDKDDNSADNGIDIDTNGRTGGIETLANASEEVVAN